MANNIGAVLLFDDFRLELQPTRLLHHGEQIALRSQPLRLLAFLASRPGELISHAEIRAHIWGDLHVDFASGIHVCIRQIRQVLGDDGEKPAFIETIPRKGYRFVANVRRHDSATESLFRKWRQPVFVAIGIAALVTLSWLAREAGNADSTDLQVVDLTALSDDPYILGRRLLGSTNENDIEASRKLFELAIQNDPDFAPAYANLAKVYEISGDFDNAFKYASEAIKHDKTYAQGYLRLAAAESFGRWDWQAAEISLNKALSLTPENVDAIIALATILVVTGRADDALEILSAALEAEPSSGALLVEHGMLSYRKRDNRRAIEKCALALTLNSDHHPSRVCSYKASVADRNYDGALVHALELMSHFGANASIRTEVASMPPAMAVNAFETWRLENLAARSGTEKISPMEFAYSAAALRKYDEALFYVVRAYEERWPGMPVALLDPIFIPIRHTSKFLELAKEVGFVFPGSASI